MILPVLVALLAALGPLLQGAWALRTQLLLHCIVAAGLCLWLTLRIFVGHIPVPSGRTLAWTLLLTALSGLSTALSPVRVPARHDWYNFLEALWMFPAMAALSKDQRSWVDEAIRVAGWILVALAFYQHFPLREARPAATLYNENMYAGAVLLFLPLAAEKSDWLLALGLAWSLWWTRSAGAWLGLSLALVVTQRRRNPFWSWCGGAIALACAVVLYGRLGTPDVLHRWWWWSAAARMTGDRPAFGFGPGAFAYVLPAYMPPGPGALFSVFAHEYPLQTTAEFGIPFAVLWFGGLWRCVERGGSHKRFGVIAVLVQSLWDNALCMPANLWLFSYFAASSMPDSPDGVNIAARRKLPALAVVGALGLTLSGRMLAEWRGYGLESEAQRALAAGDLEAADLRLAEASRRVGDDPELPRLRAELHLRRARDRNGAPIRAGWLAAAEDLREAVRLNPYRKSSWTELALVYRQLGRSDAAAAALRDSGRYFAGP